MDLFVILCTAFICVTVLLLKELLAWRSRIVPGIPAASGAVPVFGNFFSLAKAVQSSRLIDYMNGNMREQNFRCFHVLGPGVSVLSTAEVGHVEHLFSKDHFHKWVKGDQFQENFSETLGHGIFAVDGKEWAEKRKVSSYLFSSGSLRNHMAGVFLEHTQHVLDTLLETPKGDVVNLQDLFARYTFDSICTIAFGMDVNSLGGNETDIQFQRSYDFAQSTNFTRFLDPLWKIQKMLGVGIEGALPPHLERIDEYLYNIIDQRLEELKHDVDRGDMLSLYIKHGKKKNKDFNRRYLRDMVLNFLIAGRDTTAAASMWLIYEISQNPKAEEKLLQEIEQVIGEDGTPTYDTVSKMPFLKAVFYETLRLHPSVPLDGKIAAEDTYLEPGHFFIKEGTMVQFNIMMMNRDPKRFPNPEEFTPERWLNEEGGFVEMSEKEFPVFNVKPRGCLGKRMAEFEAAVLIAVLLPRLKFKVQEGFVPVHAVNAILFNQNGMMVHVEERK
mmetsp:Transcript_10887/g.16431  ORF Transcript_10887/g.16431 Transcript_10887/m.16431 type:complete len:499 (-) Transcript_10887:51-1547(-)